MSQKRSKRIEPRHKLKEYLISKKDTSIDFYASTGIAKSIVSKLSNFVTILSAERLFIITHLYSDNIANSIDFIFPNLKLPNKPSKDFTIQKTTLENILFPTPKDYISLEEISYLTDIDIERLKEILTKPTVVTSASELILLEKAKGLKKGSLFEASFGHLKIKKVLK